MRSCARLFLPRRGILPLIFFAIWLPPLLCLGEWELPLLRRVAVFPIGDVETTNGDEAWWQMRELLTKDELFLVASKRFMLNRGAFQARQKLSPADAIIVAKILDAQMLVTTWVADRNLNMEIYEGVNGQLIWKSVRVFHPALTISEQLVRLVLQMSSEFLKSIPYQGYLIQDELIAKTIYERDIKKYAQIYIGKNLQIQVGDPVQWIRVLTDPTVAVLLNGGKREVLAEGVVTKLLGDRAEVEIQKINELTRLKEFTLVRFPKTTKSGPDYVGGERPADLAPEYLSKELKSVTESNRDQTSTATTLAFIAHFVAFLLLAF